MKLVLTGASGLIGPALRSSLLADGHSVRTLVRHETGKADEDQWDPTQGLMDPDVLEGVDVVVCLSGAGVGDHRWTDSYKQTIVSSRVDSVGTVVRTMVGSGSTAKLVSASAVGYYGDTGDAVVDEQTPAGKGFLADVCVKWEGAAEPAQSAGIPVSFLRTGLVLAKNGGLLKRLVPLVKAGIGGKLGSGRQYMPWISLADEIAAIRFVIDHDLPGPVNLTGPAPARNVDLTKALGSALNRPTIFPVPAVGARIVLGEFAGDVLTGQKALPAKLQGAGFEFAHTTVETAIRAELGR